MTEQEFGGPVPENGPSQGTTPKEPVNQETEQRRLEDDLKQSSLLQFQSDGMEAQFSVCHNQLLGSADLLCIAIPLCFVCLTVMRSFYFKDQVGVKDWARCLFFPILNLSVRHFCPDLWRRYREVFWCADRFERLYATTLPQSWVFRCPDATSFAYGAGTSLLDSISHKVRFHVQVLLSAVMYMMTFPFMISNHMHGVFSLTPQYVILHFVFSVIVPGMLVYAWDFHMRQMFAAAKRAASE
eukprot:jgi/Botrbrau1/19824/Bobra.0124s0065.1